MQTIETKLSDSLIRITTKTPPTHIDDRLQTGTTSQIIQNLRIATFMGAEVLTGTPETIAEKLSAYEDVEGLEGLMVCLDDPRREIDRFGEQVLPLLGAATPA